MTKLPTWKDRHPIYGVWNGMKSRCNNPKRPNYKSYGGCGVMYSDQWVSFSNFARDMLPTWFKGAILDRRDNDKGYCKENCRWLTPTESSRNRRSNKLTAETATELRRLYSTGIYSQRKLASMFDVSLSNISHTLLNHQWLGL